VKEVAPDILVFDFDEFDLEDEGLEGRDGAG
jgi:hypothetical protein